MEENKKENIQNKEEISFESAELHSKNFDNAWETNPKIILHKLLNILKNPKQLFQTIKFKIKKTSRRKIINFSFSSTLAAVTIVMVILQFILPTFIAQGATFTWTQTSWSGGSSTDKANHSSNQNNWNKYDSKDSNITAVNGGANLQLTTNAFSTTQTNTGDQANGFNKSGSDFDSGKVVINPQADTGTGADGSVKLHRTFTTASPTVTDNTSTVATPAQQGGWGYGTTSNTAQNGTTGNDASMRLGIQSQYTFNSAWGDGGKLNAPQGIAVDSSGNIYVADTSNNRIQKLNSSGNYLSGLGSYGSGNGQFNNPQGVTLDSSGNIYVADTNNRRIQKFDSSGTFQWWLGYDGSTIGTHTSGTGSYGTGNGKFSSANSVAIDSSGNIYVTDTSNNRIQKFDSSGTFQWWLGYNGSTIGTHTSGTASSGSGNGQFNSPSKIILDSSGNIYVADASNYRIQKFDSSGTFQWWLGYDGSTIGTHTSGTGHSGSGIGQFNSPYGITIDSLGKIYLVDKNNSRIQMFDSNGVYLSQFGSLSGAEGQLAYPSDVALDSSGNIYVADTGVNRIQKFSYDASSYGFYSKFGSNGTGNGQVKDPSGIFRDLSGNMYIAETGNNRIQKFDSSGTFQWWLGYDGSTIGTHTSGTGVSGSGNGQFNYPTGVALDSSGNIYVADYLNNRIQKFDSSGTFQWWLGYDGSTIGTHTSGITSFGTGNGQFKYPSGITLDSSGNIYVADSFNNRIQKFDSSGIFQWWLGYDGSTIGTHTGGTGVSGSGNGQFGYIYDGSITLDSSGNIYVADSSNYRIQKFDSSGTFQWWLGYNGSTIGTHTSGTGVYGSGNGQFGTTNVIALDPSGNIYVSEGVYRIQKFNSSGTYLSQFGSYGSGNEQLNAPFGMVVDSSSNVYVADSGNNSIKKFVPGGGFTFAFKNVTNGNGQLANPTSVALDSSGNTYVADSFNNRIQKFDSGGNYLSQFGNGQLNSPFGIALDSSGNIYVADSGNNSIKKFNSSGTYLSQFGSSGSGNGQLIYPYAIALDSSGNIYVADTNNSRIQKFNSSGTYLSQFGSYGAGNGQFSGPYGIALDSSGNIYVGDYNNNRIQKFDSSGVFQWWLGYDGSTIGIHTSGTGVSGSGNGKFSGPRGIVVDSFGNIYVSDTNNGHSQKFDSNGNFLYQFGSFYNPIGITLDPSGNVYVADMSHGLIQKFNATQYYTPGTYVSYIDGLSNPTNVWNNISWNGTYPDANTTLSFSVKSTNSLTPPSFSSGTCVTSPSASDSTLSLTSSCVNTGDRYLWYQVTMATVDTGKTPLLNNLSASLTYANPYETTGNYTSAVLDTGQNNASWGNLNWTNSTGQTLTMKARTCSASDCAGATAWASCSNITNGQALSTGSCATNGHRYVQYQSTLSTINAYVTPSLDDVTIGYNIYPASQTLTSSVYNTTSATNTMGMLRWTEDLPTGTDIKFQMQTAPDSSGSPGTWSGFMGPNGTSGSYFTDPTGGEAIPTVLTSGNNDQWFQYKAYLTSDGPSTPILSNVRADYVVNATPNFDTSSGSGATASQIIDPNDANWGKVKIDYSIRDADTTSGSFTKNYVTPTFEYTLNGTDYSDVNLSNITFGTAPANGDYGTYMGKTTNKVLEGTNGQKISSAAAKDQLDAFFSGWA